MLEQALAKESESLSLAKLVNNKSDALREVEERLSDFDCIILDLGLPEAAADPTIEPDAGLKLLEHLRKSKRFAGTIIVLTHSCSFADGRLAFQLGCDAYLNKARDIEELVNGLKFCMLKKMLVMSPEMRHLFLPEQITTKEARLMDMLVDGAKWQEVAKCLGYKNAHAACSTADRVFDKLLTWHDVAYAAPGTKKRQLALQLWKWRHRHNSPDEFQSGSREEDESPPFK